MKCRTYSTAVETDAARRRRALEGVDPEPETAAASLGAPAGAISEERLLAAGWRETLGKVTLAMAHDFNNLLAGIYALSESLASQGHPGDNGHEALVMIKNQAWQASQLVRQLASLHHQAPGKSALHNVNALTSSAFDLAVKMLPRNIACSKHLCDTQLWIETDEVGFTQILLNAAINAAEAMPKGGRLEWRVESEPELPAGLQIRGARPAAPCVCVSMQDTGPGIAPGELERVFDADYTTKPGTAGSGLGLFLAEILARRDGAGVSIASEPGSGTRLSLWFSAAQPEGRGGGSARDPDAPLRRGAVLVVGPPGKLLAATAELLRSRDVPVLMATSRASALDVLNANQPTVRVLLVLLTANDDHLGQLLQDAASRRPGLRLLVQAIGAEPHELRPESIAAAERVLPSDVSDGQILEHVLPLLEHAKG
jgi:signal transduction histidine kinase